MAINHTNFSLVSSCVSLNTCVLSMHETSLSLLSQGVNYIWIVSLLKDGDRSKIGSKIGSVKYVGIGFRDVMYVGTMIGVRDVRA